MILLRLISWPHVRKHAVRSLLTLLGIVIGVAVFVSMHLANRSVFGAFQETVNRIAGATQLQVSAGELGMDEDVLDRVQASKNVRVAVPVIESAVGTGLAGQGNLLILGVDMTGDQSLRDYSLESGDDAVVDDPLVFLAQPDSLMVTSQFAERNHLHIDDKLPLQTADGTKQFTIRGILKSSGLNSAFGGNLAIMDIYAAQQVFGRGRKFDRIDLAANDGVSIDALRTELQNSLGPAFQVEPPSSRGASFESMSRVYGFMLKFSSVFALLIGMFIIYNSFAISVVQRRSEIGILRALGATRRQIAVLFLGESLVTGLVGSVIGLFFGILIARVVAITIGRLLEGVYGLAHTPVDVRLSPPVIAISLIIGVLTSVVAALLPARSAAKVDPVKALQKGRIQVLSAGENRVRMMVAIALALASGAVLIVSHTLRGLYLAYVFIMTGLLLLTPQLTLWLSRALRPILRAIRPVEGALAADSLVGAPRRTSATVAALVFSLALVIGLAGTARAAYLNIAEWVDTFLNPDFFVTTSESLTARNYKFPESMGAELETIPGIAQVQMARTARIRYHDNPVLLMALEARKQLQRVKRIPIEGDVTQMFEEAAEGKGVIASENFSVLQHVHLGDKIVLPTPGGERTFPVLGVVREYSDQQGAIMMDRSLFKQLWNDDAVDIFRVYLQPGADPAKVKERILDRFSGRRLFVLTNHEVRQYILRLTNQWFSLTWVQISVAILVAVLGIVNSLTVSISDRRRELGVLQAVGGLRTQIRGTIWMEALGIGAIGVLLGLAVGAIHLYYVVQISYRDYPGMHLDYLYPVSIAALLFPVILTVAFLSSLGPAESAVGASLVESLEYE